MDRQLVSQTNELKSHLFALQSQMNPHFIYNILAIISMEAQADKNDKIIKMCASLSGMMSFSASMGDGFCEMQSELLHAGHYMELMKQRYEEQFEYNIIADESCKMLRIPKLIIQPLCENCFKHAFKSKEGIWKINVSAYTEKGKWFVIVEDNGTGFSKQYLEQFAEMERTVTLQNVKEKVEELSIGGLCLPNIFIRLKLLYKEQFVCQIENTDKGSRVTLGGTIDDTSIGS
ncbi:MAG: histidine kinase [Oscillospiraceae bacterium]